MNTPTTSTLAHGVNTAEQKQIADTILEQLGGRRFIIMTGARGFTFDSAGKPGLRFRIPGTMATDGINSVCIDLEADDTYTVRFSKRRQWQCKEIKTVEYVDATELRRVFTAATGLDVHL